jgi:hypothetical protein
MQAARSPSSDVGRAGLTSQEHSLSPEAVRRIVFYVILGVAAGLAALEIELSTTQKEAAAFLDSPPPASHPERRH